ncbi:MAG: TFIIB-type zinc ribbon-containing protein, partial [Planctomycetota bacterium]|jgi:hypothetical protein
MMSPQKPRETEEEYFLKVQVQKLKEHAEKVRQAKAQKELKKLKELHWMRCPKCGMELEEITYREIKIDKCFSCGGVFLDDGELEAVAASEGSGGVLAGLSRIFGGKG